MPAATDNFMADWDGMLGYAGLNNIYLYRPPAGPAVIIPWDKDNAFHALDQSAFEGTQENVLVSRWWARNCAKCISTRCGRRGD